MFLLWCTFLVPSFHTKLYKFWGNTSLNNARMKNCTDINLGEVVYLSSIMSPILDDFYFWWRDSANQQFPVRSPALCHASVQSGVTVICVSPWYVYPRTHITSDMCIPRGDTQNTDTRLDIQWTKWRLGCEVPTSAVKSRRNQKWIRAQRSRLGFLEFGWVPTDSIVYLTKTSNSGYAYH